MGREIKHVALGFEWPLNKVWDGYLNPFNKFKCPEDDKNCFHGHTAGGVWLEAIVNLLMVAGADGRCGKGGRTGIWPHPYLLEFDLAPTYRTPRQPDEEEPRKEFNWYSSAAKAQLVVPPSKDLGELTEGLAGRSMSLPFGHDACDRWSAVKKIVEAAGLTASWTDENGVFRPGWGICPVCGGDGYDPAHKQQREAWQRTEPPYGPGWQVWETVSEGSPVSPVFATKEELVEWLVAVKGHSQATAEAFVENEWVPTMMTGPSGLKVGIDCAETMKKKEKKDEEPA